MKFGQGTQLNLLNTIMIINKQQIIDNFFVFALIVFSSNASFISSDEIYISLFFLFTLGYAIKKRIFQFSIKQLFSILFLVIFISPKLNLFLIIFHILVESLKKTILAIIFNLKIKIILPYFLFG